MKKKPMLSIGMIFKNEIRCLERCLKSLEPLRELIPCELVMADTGSDDGSRTVAEKYADILFDFPWINDFAAARNAVMDRCSGKWYLSIDADEWLDEDVKELSDFFKNDTWKQFDACALTERNYYSYDLKGGYGAFMPWRMIRMSTGQRYSGAIHEGWNLLGLRLLLLQKTLLHHDGYVGLNTADGKNKRDRNMKLLREKLEKDPDNLLARLQFIESGGMEPDFLDNLRKAVALVEEKAITWDTLGASVFRYAIGSARTHKLPEMEKWLHEAEEWFLDSYFIRMDAAFNAATYYLEAENYSECVRWGEIGLKSYEDYRAGKGEIACQLYGSIQTSMPLCEMSLKVVLSRGYFEAGRIKEAEAVLAGIDYTVLDALWTKNLLETLHMIQHRSDWDTAPLITSFWEGINKPEPAEDWADRRRNIFIETGTAKFASAYREQEKVSEGFHRHVFLLYKPLAGQCPLGTAAAVMASDNPAEMAGLLESVEKWDELPISAVSHALKSGMAFPVSGRPMKIEEADKLASRLSAEPELLPVLLNQYAGTDFTSAWQTLIWSRALALAAVQSCSWKDADAGMDLARTFAKVEGAFLPRCYMPDALCEDGLCVLPPLHRFGWYCAQAFDKLDAGDAVGYVRLLRAGLSTYEGMKPMVEFLTEHTPQLQAAKPTGELLALAEKVREMLSAYAPDDPAVVMIKQSAAYQKVAHLIEGPELGVFGGLSQ